MYCFVAFINGFTLQGLQGIEVRVFPVVVSNGCFSPIYIYRTASFISKWLKGLLLLKDPPRI